MTVPVSAVVTPALSASTASAAGPESSVSGTATQITRAPADPHAAQSAARTRPPISPRLAACCEIVMGLTMGYMLITML
jgi:hypothetical protein